MSIDINDWLADTRDVRVVGRDQLLSEATKPRYFCLSKMFKNAEKRFKGGENLKDYVQGESLGNASWYNPVDRFNVSTRDTQFPITVPWAFCQGHYPIVKEAQSLNAGDDDAFVDYVMSLEQACLVDKVNLLEESCWGLPNRELMEDTNTQGEARQPYSFLSLITRDGLAPSASNGGLATGSSAWTTVQTINPSTYTWWQNQNETYTAGDPHNSESGILNAFDVMIEKVQFEAPGPLRRYAEDTTLQGQVIATNLDGIKTYKSTLRANNDRMDALNDPTIRGPQFQGVPVVYVSELDNAGWTADQPDYLFINLNWVFPFVHTDNYFSETITPGGVNHPNKTVVWKFTWTNRIMRSRRRQGRVYAA